jgi:hypothetical protein
VKFIQYFFPRHSGGFFLRNLTGDVLSELEHCGSDEQNSDAKKHPEIEKLTAMNIFLWQNILLISKRLS